MITIKVINKGKRMRDRLGIRFDPGIEVELDVTARQKVVLDAVKDFEVKKVDGEKASSSFNSLTNSVAGQDIKALQEKTVDDFIETIKEDNISIHDAIEIENQGRQRVTLLKQLEDLAGG